MDLLRRLWLDDAGLAFRIAIGAAIFLTLAIIDLARHGRAATRWKEYVFLAGCTGAVMLYGLANDMVTVTISPVYFAVHEGLSTIPDDIRWLAARVALKGCWTGGLLLGVALLLANNPRKNWPRLGYGHLAARVVPVLLLAGLGATFAGTGCYVLNLEEARHSPALARFDVVYYAHFGAYVGSAIGAVWSVAAVVIRRRRLAKEPGEAVNRP